MGFYLRCKKILFIDIIDIFMSDQTDFRSYTNNYRSKINMR